MPTGSAGRSRIEIFKAWADEVSKALVIENADDSIGRELGQKTLQTIGGIWRNHRGSDNGKRHRWLDRRLGRRPGLAG